METFLRKIRLVCWKNYVLRKRHWLLTLLEVVLPTFLFIILLVGPDMQPHRSNRQEFQPMSVADVMSSGLVYEAVVYYSPPGGYAEKLVNSTAAYLHSFNKYALKNVQSFKTEEDLFAAYAKLVVEENIHYFFAIIFDEAMGDVAPKHLKYKIKGPQMIDTDSLFNIDRVASNSGYMSSGIVQLQMALEKVYSDDVSKNSSVSRSVLLFPSPPFTRTDTDLITFYISLLAVISFCTLSLSVLKRVVEEKETGVRELMKLMGLDGWMLWTGWLLNSLLVNGISITVITTLLILPAGGPILSSVNPFLLWMFLMLYCTVSIFFMFLVSAFFSRPMLAMTFGLLSWFISFFLFVFINSKLPHLLMCFLPNMALFYGMKVILMHQAQEITLGWEQLFSLPPTGDLSMGSVWIVMIISSLLFAFVRYYVESVMPGQYGIAKPWHFLFSEWVCCTRNKVETVASSGEHQNFEPPGANLVTGIRARDVRKVYQKFMSQTKKVAVDGVSIDIYRNNITALLGHNGAGKTTFMSLLAGMFSPSSGSIEIEGHDVVLELSKVRESLGLCPQHNMHFSDLTVREHFLFFAMLKGLSHAEANLQATAMLKKLDLFAKEDVLPPKLSGGMKRKLSLGIALVGDCKVLLLDEPTAGMDPEVRRKVWDMLLTMRGHRTIIITTHFMEEADVLGDRIAIMDHGKVKCYGTSIFLKKLYGAGYHLTLTKGATFKAEDVTELIKSEIPEAVVRPGKGPLQSYTLPLDKVSHFPKLFDSLEQDKDKFGVVSIGVSVTTMEEVFLKVGELDDPVVSDSRDAKGHYDEVDGYSALGVSDSSSENVRGLRLLLEQLKVLMLSRIYYTCQSRIVFIFKLLLPALLMAATLSATSSNGADSLKTLRAFDLAPYAPSEVLLKADSGAETVSARYEALVKLAGSHVRRPQEDLVPKLMAEGDADLERYYRFFVAAAEFNETKATALYSSVALHSLPASLQLVTNALLGDAGRVSGAFQRLPSEEDIRSGSGRRYDKMAATVAWAVLAPLGFLLPTALCVAFPLRQRISRVKQLQAMIGVAPATFWGATVLLDLAQHLVGTCVALFVAWLMDRGGVLTEASGVGFLVLILVLYGVAALPFSYLWSYAWNSVASAFAATVLTSVMTGMVGSVALMLLPGDHPRTSRALRSALSVVPYFSLCGALGSYAGTCVDRANCRLQLAEQRIRDDGLCAQELPFDVASHLWWLLGDAAIFFAALFLLDHRVVSRLYAAAARQLFPVVVTPDAELDADVLEERRRVRGNNGSGDELLVDGLVLNYEGFTAVKGISFGVAAGECFGLLGVNGAGKTSTFAALTGDLEPRAGNAFARGYSLRKKRSSYLASLGYCPQSDAVDDHLSVRHNLEAMARLRGTPPSVVSLHVDKWIANMDLGEYAATRASRLSGGTRRKLCAAAALVAAPALVFLDEPTAGVDPVSRRRLWAALRQAQGGGQSVVLTSHSMDECEALCGRVGVMAAGQLRGIGHQQHLKRRHGSGFTLTLKVDAAVVSEEGAQAAVAAAFGACELRDAHQGMLQFHLSLAAPWSRLFADAEKLQQTLPGLEDYCLSETTLEEVFLSFAHTQY